MLPPVLASGRRALNPRLGGLLHICDTTEQRHRMRRAGARPLALARSGLWYALLESRSRSIVTAPISDDKQRGQAQSSATRGEVTCAVCCILIVAPARHILDSGAPSFLAAGARAASRQRTQGAGARAASRKRTKGRSAKRAAPHLSVAVRDTPRQRERQLLCSRRAA